RVSLMEGVRLSELHDGSRLALDDTRVPLARAADGGLHVTWCAGALLTSGVPGDSLAQSFFVPGRIEVLGKHTAYAGGRSLLAACERGFAVVAAPRIDRRMSVLDVVSGERASFALDPELEPTAGWANYPMTVARRIARNFPEAR